jgi:uncharacterized protein YegJ (DUF2314 family)
VPWTLDNAEARAAEAPHSFFIPPAEVRHSLKRGDEVKLIFRLERDDGAVAVERMWVEVVDTDPYVGLLRNEPQLEGVVAFGDRVEFAPAHVAAYAYTAAQLGYDPAERCFLLKRVAESVEPPPLLLFTADALREGSQRHGIRRLRPREIWWRWDGSRYVRTTDS